MDLTPDQIASIEELIDFYNTSFIFQNVSPDVLTSADIDLLKKFGIDVSSLSATSSTETAFRFGMLSQVLKDADLNNLDYSKMKEYVEKRGYIPLNAREKSSLSFLNKDIYSSIKGLGNKIIADFNDVLVEDSAKKRREYEKIIEREGKKAIYSRKNARELTQALRDTQDYARDFRRIAETTMSLAFNQGRAAMVERELGDDAKVWIKVQGGACDHCKKKYTDGGVPKIFDLQELLSNGTNQGRKQKDWLAVVPPMHPYCRCTLMKVLPGQVYDKKSGRFVTTSQRKVPRKSKVKIQTS